MSYLACLWLVTEDENVVSAVEQLDDQFGRPIHVAPHITLSTATVEASTKGIADAEAWGKDVLDMLGGDVCLRLGEIEFSNVFLQCAIAPVVPGADEARFFEIHKYAEALVRDSADMGYRHKGNFRPHVSFLYANLCHLGDVGRERVQEVFDETVGPHADVVFNKLVLCFIDEAEDKADVTKWSYVIL